MALQLIIDDSAFAEYLHSSLYYAEHSDELADRFEEAVQKRLEQIAEKSTILFLCSWKL